MAQEANLQTFGIFEKIRDVVPEHMINNRNSILIESVTQKEEEFIDLQYPPTMDNLLPLKRENMKFISWFRIKQFFSDGKYCLFNNIKVRSQILRDKGYSYLIDSLNILSTQPGLIIRLFEYTEKNDQGIYSIWVNVNGIWKEILVDENIPIYSL